MALTEYLLKRERGTRQIVLQKSTDAEIQTFAENEIRTAPEDGAVIVYKRYASCAIAAEAPVSWTMDMPPTPA